MSGFTIPHDAWVLIADSEKALFLRNEGDEEHMNLEVIREMEQDNPPIENRRLIGAAGSAMAAVVANIDPRSKIPTGTA